MTPSSSTQSLPLLANSATFIGCFEAFFNSPKLYDVEINVGDEVIKGHRFFLSARNQVFATMFEKMDPKSEPSSIDIPDCDAKTFKVFLKYLYTNKIYPEDITPELLIIAHEWVDDELKNICEIHLNKKVTIENAVNSFLVATRYKCKLLKRKSLHIILDNYDIIKTKEEFERISSEKIDLLSAIESFHDIYKEIKNHKIISDTMPSFPSFPGTYNNGTKNDGSRPINFEWGSNQPRRPLP